MVNTLHVEGQQELGAKMASKLRGSTLLVYWYFIASQPKGAGPREVVRAIRFQSPSTALFHLDKLVESQLH